MIEPRTHGWILPALLLMAPSVSAQDAWDDGDPALTIRRMAMFGGTGIRLGRRQSEPEIYWDLQRIDALPPAGVFHAVTLVEDDWMISYRYFFQSFHGMRDGRDNISTSTLLGSGTGYTSTPRKMTTQTHVFEALYGFDDDWTLFAMVPYLRKDMTTNTLTDDFDTDSEGIGDLRLGVIRTIKEEQNTMFRVHFGVGIPTGKFDEKDHDETNTNITLPYVMQLGTGTFDFYPGAVFMKQMEGWTWGVQTAARIHVGKNSDDWAVSDSNHLTGWYSKQISETIAGSLRFDFFSWGDYHGASKDLDPDANPANDPHRQGGNRLDLLGGFNFELGDGYDQLHRIAVEVGLPVDEWLDGPQLSSEWMATIGWQLSF
ncbi:MAG: hypothetical protein E2O39_16690 [Planctomycetota bacterium]|nr:MAG: hypothetical protein E2O39_16690 [Planctomycetota bacterium]